MSGTWFRCAAALAAALWFVAPPTAQAGEAEVLRRLNNLETRMGALETAVGERDAAIAGLERQLQERDAKIESLEKARRSASGTSAVAAPAAGGAMPSAHPVVESTNQAVPVMQRLDTLEQAVSGLAEDVDQSKAQAGTRAKSGVKVSTEGGLKVETDDGQFSAQLIGRLNVDAAFYDQDKSRMGDGAQLRRARLGMTGKVFGDWIYKFEADFARETAVGTVGVKDAYISYLGWDPAQLTVGNFKEPFSINNLTSANYLTFVERPLPITQTTSSLVPDRHIGIGASHYDSNWSVSIGAFMKHTDDPAPSNEGDQAFDLAGRVTYDPVLERDRLVHVGISGLYRNPSDSSVAFSLKPESNVTSVRFLNTGGTPTALNPGALTAVNHLFDVDPEVALVYGPLSLLGEYFWMPISQTQEFTCPNPSTTAVADDLRRCPDVSLTGWYAEMSYFLTGESKPYNAATARFDRLIPNHNLGKGGIGAIELAGRISRADFDDGPEFQKGTETNYTFGLNWYVNPNIRFMMNYISVSNNASAAGNTANLLPGFTSDSYDDPQILEFRAQVDW